MNNQQAFEIISALTRKGIHFETGLNDNEVEKIESKFHFLFPDDLRLFLQNGLHISEGFVNWRQGLVSEGMAENINSRLNWPLDGMIFDIKNNDFWFEQWGERPDGLQDRIALATKFYLTYPRLIPVYDHRYIPSRPHQAGNPVFSIQQMDIIYYGYDLISYFTKEFKIELPGDCEVLTEPNVEIEFWSYWTVYN
jgi:hypothetical protein